MLGVVIKGNSRRKRAYYSPVTACYCRYSESSSTASVGQEMKETRLTVNTVHHRTAGKAWAVQPLILSTRLLMIIR